MSPAPAPFDSACNALSVEVEIGDVVVVLGAVEVVDAVRPVDFAGC
jgi:hypothetical protein